MRRPDATILPALVPTLVPAFMILGGAALLGGCASHPRPTQVQAVPPRGTARTGTLPEGYDPRVPPFAAAGWEKFSRASAVAIAVGEWRRFGSPVDDDPPDSRPPLPAEQRPERQAGFWQRIGEYWWEGMPPDTPEAAATGLHDGLGTLVEDDTYTPWSAAFVSYVMRIAGALDRFPYSPSHSTYINAAVAGNDVLRAHPIESYAPQLGDLACFGRGASAGIRFAALPTAAPFNSHCSIVVAVTPGQISVVGGNVDDAVTMTHVPTTASGTISDPRYDWFVMLEVRYDVP